MRCSSWPTRRSAPTGRSPRWWSCRSRRCSAAVTVRCTTPWHAAAALTHALEGLEVQLLVRIGGDRVFYDGRPGPRKPGPGRNGVHGQRFELAADADLRRPDELLVIPDTSHYGRVEVRAWHGM